MASLFSRFRKRATSSASASVPVASESAPDPITTAIPSAVVISEDASPPRVSPVDRRIYPDLAALMEGYSAPRETESFQGLRPMPSARSRRHSVDGSNTWRTQSRLTSRHAPPVLVHDSLPEMEEPSSSSAAQIMNHGEWSTFGRTRDHTSPRIGDFADPSAQDSPVPRPSSKLTKGTSNSGSLRSNATSPRSHITSRHSISPSGAPPTLQNSQSSSPEAAHSSPQTRTSDIPDQQEDNRHSSDSPSNTHSSSQSTTHTPTRRRSMPFHATPSPHSARISQRASKDLAFDSPRTFGQPTPPSAQGRRPGSGQSFGFVWEGEAPPMPALDHPALNVSLAVRAQALDRQAHSSQGFTPPAAESTREKENKTYPPRSARVSQKSSFSTLPFGFGRPFRSRSHSTPKAQHIFNFNNTAENTESSARSPTTSTPQRRTMTGSMKKKHVVRRRRSADWSSSQALAGANASGEFTWPAQVSREMLKMSLGQPAEEEERHIANGSENTSRKGIGSTGSAHSRGKSVPESSSPGLRSPFALEGESKLSKPHDRHDHSTNLGGSADATGGLESRMIQSESPQSDSSGKGKASSSLPIASIFAGNTGSSLQPPALAVTSPTPGTSPGRPSTDHSTSSDPQLLAAGTPPTRSESLESSNSIGKRKASDDVDTTPPDRKKGAKAKFTIPADPRAHRTSGTSASSHAPSSYQRKRARISGSPPVAPPSTLPRPGTGDDKAANTGSWSSRTSGDSRGFRESSSKRISQQAASRTASTRSKGTADPESPRQTRPRRSMSQSSIPISALVSPHAPSITPSGTFYMRDPRKPRKIQQTGWALALKDDDNEEVGSPLHAWLFFLGFVVFPVWWLASFLKVPRTRTVGGTDTEKAVVVDDPQVEHDAKSWRLRCRVMSAISLVTYIPFIVLIAIFIRR